MMMIVMIMLNFCIVLIKDIVDFLNAVEGNYPVIIKLTRHFVPIRNAWRAKAVPGSCS